MNDKSITRRKMLKTVSAGFGYLAFQGLAVQASAKETGGVNTSKPLGAKKPHFSAKAKRVIFLCMRGGPSHMETFDPKPKLSADNGKVAKNQNSKLLGSRWKFSKHGQSGIEIVDLLPETAKHADKLCVLRGMHTDNENHPQALEQMHTGSFQFIRPSLGFRKRKPSWLHLHQSADLAWWAALLLQRLPSCCKLRNPAWRCQPTCPQPHGG
jgi:hypothetical protein